MIREAFEYLLTPKSPLAKKYGFLYSSVALKHRYERCKKIWLPHLKNCQDLFTASVQSLKQKNSVVILGSAHLHEIPLHLLLENFSEITLVDVIHPLSLHWAAKRYPRIKLITQDLTQSLTELDKHNSLEELLSWLEQAKSREAFHFDADLIVSANLLSQLGLLPISSIEKKLKRTLTLEEKDQVCTAFANLHVQSLLKCQGKKLLYADREILYRDPQGEIIYQGSYPVSFDGMKALKSWIWLLAPLKEASKDYSIEMKIEAYESEAT
jgi:hypothetical protein